MVHDLGSNWSVVLLCFVFFLCFMQQTGPTSGSGVEMAKQNDLRTDHRPKMTKIKDMP